MLHPDVPNCSTAFVHHILLSTPPLARILTVTTVLLSFKKLKALLTDPIPTINHLSKRIITWTAVLSTSAGSAWGSLCLWNMLFARSTLPTKRFFLSGAVSGLPFAFVNSNRNMYLSIFRASLDSAWKVGAKHDALKIVKGVDLWLIVASWALMGAILDSRPSSVSDKGVRRTLSWLKGEGYKDTVAEAAREQLKAEKARSE